MGKEYPTEIDVQNRIVEYLTIDSGDLWFPPKNEHELHSHGVDIWLKGNRSGTRQFFIECKGKSSAKKEKSRNSIDRETSWLQALAQLVTRIKSKRITSKGKIAKNPCYGLGLYWKSAQVALYRISKNVSSVLNLYILSVDEEGFVKVFTPSEIGNKLNKLSQVDLTFFFFLMTFSLKKAQ